MLRFFTTIPRSAERRAQREYHDQIVAWKSVAEAYRFFELKRPEPLDPINHATALHRLANFSRKKQAVKIPAELHIGEFTPEWRPRAISNVLWAAGALNAPGIIQDFKVSSLTGLPQGFNSWSAKDLVNGLWGLTACEHLESGNFLASFEESFSRLDGVVTAVESALLIWCRAKLCPHEFLPDRYVALLKSRIHEMEFRDLSMSIWSLGKTRTVDEEVAAGSVERARMLLARGARPESNQQILANLIWGYAESNINKSESMLELLRDHVNLFECSAEQVTMILTSFARESLRLPESTDRVMFDSSYRCRELVNTIWALSRYVRDQEDLLIRASVALSRLGSSELSVDDVSMLSRALGSAYYGNS